MARCALLQPHGLTALLALVLVPSLAAAPSGIETVVQANYPGILATWARGEEAAALAELATLEERLVGTKNENRNIEELWRAKLGVVRDAIAGSSVEVLVPIMLLQHDASRHYAEKRSFLLARHAEVMSAELADFYVKKSTDPAAPRVAGALLASLAGHLQSGLVMRRSADLFHQALSIDPRNFAAHMGLASMFERRGELEAAQEHYSAAADIEPGSAEALLRHAVCAARRGETELAAEQLDRVLALDGPDWVLKVAYQEKARLKGDPAAGAAVAREAQTRFPGSRQMIQLSFLLERQREPQRALETLEGLPDTAEPESERYGYARWPEDALRATREALRQAAQRQNALLARAAGAPSGLAPAE